MIQRKDKLKNKAEVVKALIKDPLKTERQIAKEVGIGNGTAHRHISDLEQKGAEGKIMDKVLEMDDKILNLVNGLHVRDIEKKVAEGKELSLSEHKILGDLANNSTKRKAIFGDTGEKKINDITIQI